MLAAKFGLAAPFLIAGALLVVTAAVFLPFINNLTIEEACAATSQ